MPEARLARTRRAYDPDTEGWHWTAYGVCRACGKLGRLLSECECSECITRRDQQYWIDLFSGPSTVREEG